MGNLNRKQKIAAFWERNWNNRIELYTKFLGYVPIESITYEDEAFIYDCWRLSIKERFENPLLEKIEERELFIISLFNSLLHNKDVMDDKKKFEELYNKYEEIIKR